MSAYQLPTVWQDEASNQGAFTGLNKPTAGARFECDIREVSDVSLSITDRMAG